MLGGGITYLSFKPCCDKLKVNLRDTILSNPNYKYSLEDDIVLEQDCSDKNED